MQRPSQQAAASTLDPRVRQPRLESKRRRRADAGEVLPLPVFRYRRLRIQGDQGRGGLGCSSLYEHTLIVNSKIVLLIVRVSFVKIESKVPDWF